MILSPERQAALALRDRARTRPATGPEHRSRPHLAASVLKWRLADDAWGAPLLRFDACKAIGGKIASALLLLIACWLPPLAAIDFTPHGTQPGLLSRLAEPIVCRSCHGETSLPSSTFVPHTTWSGSMMAHATRDPLFWAALDVANRDQPGIGDWCLRCHTPVGWLGGRVSKTGNSAIPGETVNGSNGCLLRGDFTADDGSQTDYSGVTCHQCHRMKPLGPGATSAPAGSGNFWLDDANFSNMGECGDQPCRYGPYNYTAKDTLTAPHAWAYSNFTVSGAMCGTCHDVSSPILDTGLALKTLIVPNMTNAGRDTGLAFPAERTFSEWRQSSFGNAFLVDSFERPGSKTASSVRVTDCQDCHMRTSTDANARACNANPFGSRTGELPVHEFVGGGAWPLKLIKVLYAGVADLDRESVIDQAIAWSEQLLSLRSATVDVTLAPWASGSGPLQATVKVTNLSGHKLPTGYSEGRRMWLLVEAFDANGVALFTSGGWNPSTGDLTADAQLKMYETLQGQWNATTGTCETTDAMGRPEFHFVLNNCVAKDNRIPPLGLVPSRAGDPEGLELRPVGYSYPETSPGSGILVNYDTTPYAITIPGNAVLPVTVRATVQYQTASKEYITFLRNQAVENGQPSENVMCGRTWTEGPANKSRGQFMFDLWDDPALGRSPPIAVAIDSSTTTP